MNDGLALLVAWAQWVALVGLLVFAIARRVADHHQVSDFTYRRERGPAQHGDGHPSP